MSNPVISWSEQRALVESWAQQTADRLRRQEEGGRAITVAQLRILDTQKAIIRLLDTLAAHSSSTCS